MITYTIKETKSRLFICENPRLGFSHSCHPSIHSSGSPVGMVKKGYWKEKDIIVKANGFFYNYSKYVIEDYLDLICARLENPKFLEAEDSNILFENFIKENNDNQFTINVANIIVSTDTIKTVFKELLQNNAKSINYIIR